MRGKADSLLTAAVEPRITPAYAGKRVISMFHTNVLWDHPRLCGEKFVWRYVNHEKVGSPPPMRGKVWDQFQSVHIYRITPAYAGKRSCKAAS